MSEILDVESPSGKLLSVFQLSIQEPSTIMKFSIQDATLAASYSQLAASALGLSSIWIGMFDEEKVKEIIGTDLRPTSMLCVGYPIKKRPAKQRRQLKELIHVVTKKD